jgi:hypothetical protein
MIVFCAVTPCGSAVPEDGGSMFYRNVGIPPPPPQVAYTLRHNPEYHRIDTISTYRNEIFSATFNINFKYLENLIEIR